MRIKIVFFDWDSFYGKIIKFGTKCRYSHVGIMVYHNSDKVIIYEALDKGLVKNIYTNKQIIDLQLNDKILIKTLKNHYNSQDIVRTCEQYLGTPYDWLTIFNIACYILFGEYALNIKGPRLLICSEFVARVLYDLGINLSKELNKPYDYITPADIYNYLK